jgi:hypothetical protein
MIKIKEIEKNMLVRISSSYRNYIGRVIEKHEVQNYVRLSYPIDFEFPSIGVFHISSLNKVNKLT